MKKNYRLLTELFFKEKFKTNVQFVIAWLSIEHHTDVYSVRSVYRCIIIGYDYYFDN